MDNQLNILKEIQHIEAPGILFVKIKSDIQNRKKEKLTPHTTYAIVIAASILLFINAHLMYKYTSEQNQRPNITNSLQLMQDNNLYK